MSVLAACASLKGVKRLLTVVGHMAVPVSLGCLLCLDIEIEWTDKMQVHFYRQPAKINTVYLTV